MNLDKVISKKKKNLIHGSHGGEIYRINAISDPNTLIDFSTNINPLVTPETFTQVFMSSINQVSKYPDSNSTQLKEELVKYFGNKITMENLIIGAGSTELISIFCDMFINPGDEIIIIKPTFSVYEWAIKKNGGNIVNVYRKPENDFQIECEPIINQITFKTKIIFLCNPNNPNGLLDNLESLEKIINFASKNDVLVFLDEAFIEFTGESNSFASRITSFDNLFVSRSFTKFFGLPGLRIGFGVSVPEIIDIITRGQVLWPVNCIGQIIAQEILKSKKFTKNSLHFFSEEIKFMKNELKKIPGLKIFPTHTNYILINLENTGIKAAKVKKLLLEKKILIRDCSNYDGLNEYYIRISIKTRKLNLKLISSLKKIFQPQMYKKGRILINKAIKEKKLTGINEECKYLPCHDRLEDCTFCYCPFYPCYEHDSGGVEIISSKTGKPVWSCSSCIFPHIIKNAEKILKGLIKLGPDIDLISREKLMKLRAKILNKNLD